MLRHPDPFQALAQSLSDTGTYRRGNARPLVKWTDLLVAFDRRFSEICPYGKGESLT